MKLGVSALVGGDLVLGCCTFSWGVAKVWLVACADGLLELWVKVRR